MAGVDPNTTRLRKVYSPEEIAEVVGLVKELQSLYGKERKERMGDIYSQHKTLINCHFGSLKGLCKDIGLPVDIVDPKIYRSEADVLHDLQLIKASGGILSFKDIGAHSFRLYEAIREHGWGRSLLEKRPQIIKFPECDPKSGLLKDILIVWRRRLKISRKEAASLLGVTANRYGHIEGLNRSPRPEELENIKKRLKEAKISLKRLKL